MNNLDRAMREMLKNHVLEQVLDAPKFQAFYLKLPEMGRMDSTLFLFTPEGVIICGDLCPGNDSRNSGVQAYGYGLSWFAGRLSRSYLCEKFLSEQWYSDLAAEDCREIAENIMLGETGHFDCDKELEDLIRRRETLAVELSMFLECRRHPEDGESRERLAIAIKELRVVAASTRAELVRKRTEYAEKYIDLANEVENGEMGVERFSDAVREIDSEAWEAMPGYGYQPRAAALLSALQEKFAELYCKLAPEAIKV